MPRSAMGKLLTRGWFQAALCVSVIGAISFAEPAFSTLFFSGAEKVNFDSVAYTYPPSPFKVKQAKKLGIPVKTNTELSIPLTGYLAKPVGEGPFPAVILLHACAGVTESSKVWSDRLVAWGYVALTVDSLTPRGEKYICGREDLVSPWIRTLDAYGAKRYLSSHPFVDSSRIAAMGMSLGGNVVLQVIKESTSKNLAVDPFRAAVALYPYCKKPEAINTPTLILIGAADQWASADECVQFLERIPPPHEITLKVFPGAHHVFDQPGMDMVELGKINRYHPEAAELAIEMIREHFDERL
jgi:dienelactone hydrolase